MTHIDRIAQAVADQLTTQAGAADVPDRYADWIDPDMLAQAAIDALGLTEEWGLQIRYGDRVISTNPMDRDLAGAVARQSVTEPGNARVVSRVVGVWVEDKEQP